MDTKPLRVKIAEFREMHSCKVIYMLPNRAEELGYVYVPVEKLASAKEFFRGRAHCSNLEFLDNLTESGLLAYEERQERESVSCCKIQ